MDRPGWQSALQWTGDERVTFMEQFPGRGWDVCELDRKSGEVTALVATEAGEYCGFESPSGVWLAYLSDETGHLQVYLRPRKEPGRKQCVSVEGGTEPVWSRDGRELYFRHLSSVYAVDVPAEPGQPIGAPRELFTGQYIQGFSNLPAYDVDLDGRRFVMVEGAVGQTTRRLEVFVDFAAELARLLPP
jgi:hypothetical protein